jgi:hypothetical protein
MPLQGSDCLVLTTITLRVPLPPVNLNCPGIPGDSIETALGLEVMTLTLDGGDFQSDTFT